MWVKWMATRISGKNFHLENRNIPPVDIGSRRGRDDDGFTFHHPSFDKCKANYSSLRTIIANIPSRTIEKQSSLLLAWHDEAYKPTQCYVLKRMSAHHHHICMVNCNFALLYIYNSSETKLTSPQFRSFWYIMFRVMKVWISAHYTELTTNLSYKLIPTIE